jgi:glycosyltransferase involved in cell wall biosynthesis
MARTGRIVFDITDMVRFAHEDWQVTGIARVSLTLAYQAAALRPDIVRIGYFDVVPQTYRLLDEPSLLADAARLRSHLKRSTGYVKPLKTWKHREQSVRRRFHQLKRSAAFGAERIKQSLWRHRFAEPPLTFEPGDRMISLGGGWGALQAFAHVNRDGGRRSPPEITTLVHDIIPLVMPSWPGTVDPKLFTHWLRQMFARDATFLFYSRSTENDFRNWCAEQGIGRAKTRRFRLGDQLIASDGGAIRDEVRRLQNSSYMLCVGSVAGRKNGANLIHALRMLREKRKDKPLPYLVLAGSTNRSELEKLVGGDPGLDTLVFINKPSDTELGFLYRHCRFTVFPSLYEGWGLPIGESLWHGKLCATSNCSSMPEVGGEACDYFDPTDPGAIAHTLERLIFSDQYLAERTGAIDRTRLRSWRDSATELLDALGGPPRILATAQGDHGSVQPVMSSARVPQLRGDSPHLAQ